MQPRNPSAIVPKHFIVGTAGHIDHGKSTLVEALTGTDPDRLPEEKARGMTIDLGFAHLPVTDPDTSAELSLGLVDVPGHADFVKNMVAGVAAIDACLVVVASDDGWMPQTEEHLQILSYLGVERGVIALTKSDLLEGEEDREMLMAFLAESLEGTFLADAPIVPTCALGGEGVEEVKIALAAVLRDAPPPASIGKPRLNVDRVFSPKGVGTVVTGTLCGGALSVGDTVAVGPAGHVANLRAIQSHSASLDTALPGTRVALNLPDLVAGHVAGKAGIARGDVVSRDPGAETSRILDVWLEKSPRDIPGQPASSKPVKDGGKVRFHLGSGSVGARILLHGPDQLNGGAACFAQLRLEFPCYAHAGDRFVLRDWGKKGTVAGGVILDPLAAAGRFHTPERLAYLEKVSLALEADDCPALAASILDFKGTVPVERFLSQTPVPVATVGEIRSDASLVVEVGGQFVSPRWWSGVVEEAAGRIRNFHAEHPEKPSYPIKNFRGVYEKALPRIELVDPLMETLIASGFVKARGGLRAVEHLPSLPDHLKAAADRIVKALDADPREPPNLGELTPGENEREAMQYLLDTGQALTLDAKNVIGVRGFDLLKERTIALLGERGAARAAEIREATGTTRRILIPFLEALDRQGVTVRDGDFRRLKGGPPAGES